MAQDDVDIHHQDGHWYTRNAGESRNVGGPFRTKEEAIEAGRRYAGRRRPQHEEHHGTTHAEKADKEALADEDRGDHDRHEYREHTDRYEKRESRETLEEN
ncbi:DUF2188 domain-containing protein [Herbiconiux liangxiaofengii]|uniref:DUF2188 domain-containing protein n=1 Tax=Herbiconiux liangxiaofengii TaxID=3342795 RepID=UPI0035BB721E